MKVSIFTKVLFAASFCLGLNLYAAKGGSQVASLTDTDLSLDQTLKKMGTTTSKGTVKTLVQKNLPLHGLIAQWGKVGGQWKVWIAPYKKQVLEKDETRESKGLWQAVVDQVSKYFAYKEIPVEKRKEFLKQHFGNLVVTDDDKRNPLHKALMLRDGIQSLDAVQAVLDALTGKDKERILNVVINQKDINGLRPIYYTILKGNVEQFALLVKRGADVLFRDKKDRNLLFFIACVARDRVNNIDQLFVYKKMVDMLLEKGVRLTDPDSSGRNILCAGHGAHLEGESPLSAVVDGSLS